MIGDFIIQKFVVIFVYTNSDRKMFSCNFCQSSIIVGMLSGPTGTGVLLVAPISGGVYPTCSADQRRRLRLRLAGWGGGPLSTVGRSGPQSSWTWGCPGLPEEL